MRTSRHGDRTTPSIREKKPTATPHVDEVSTPHRSAPPPEGASLKRPSRRKVFEAHYRAQYLQAHARLPDMLACDNNGDYVQSVTQIAWETWQAADAHALALAAQLCEHRQVKYINPDSKAICRLCANDIRALLFDAAGENE
ncbi:hypothetical protein [Paraburkholderia dinghuensis]|uniref:Uncharacterized protein n=1 Tax=Paraburkholderia dinghuensis TaxID=2305225 RepID=A0A3N6MLS8_9BURK|nr:hypothetical protein [Paraburkholderia dinghuensis]RQH04659.1 hypothetical protein D1Y85_17355 [Paraburkholderia dinghuensis]